MAISKGGKEDPKQVIFTDKNGVQHDCTHVYWRRSSSDQYIHVWPDPKFGKLRVYPNNTSYGTTVPYYSTATDIEVGTYNIKAIPKSGYRFRYWMINSVKNTNNPVDVEVLKDQTTTAYAYFNKPQCTVTVKSDNTLMGTTNVTYNKKSVDLGTKLDLVATPKTGYVFLRWSDGVKVASRSVTLTTEDKAYEYIAYFEARVPTQVTVRTANLNMGYVIADGTQSGVVTINKYVGDQVTFKAVKTGWHAFTNWSDGSTDAERTITLSSPEPSTYIANFKQISAINMYFRDMNGSSIRGAYASLYAKAPGASDFEFISDSLTSYTCDTGTVIKLVPHMPEHYIFVNWSTGETSSELVITLDKNKLYDVIGYMRIPMATLVTSVEGDGTITPNGTHQYYLGTEVTITATPNRGQLFDHWDGSSDNEHNTITVKLDEENTYNITAHFITDPEFNKYYLKLVYKKPNGGSINWSSNPMTYVRDITEEFAPQYPGCKAELYEVEPGALITGQIQDGSDYTFKGWETWCTWLPNSDEAYEVNSVLYKNSYDWRMKNINIRFPTEPTIKWPTTQVLVIDWYDRSIGEGGYWLTTGYNGGENNHGYLIKIFDGISWWQGWMQGEQRTNICCKPLAIKVRKDIAGAGVYQEIDISDIDSHDLYIDVVSDRVTNIYPSKPSNWDTVIKYEWIEDCTDCNCSIDPESFSYIDIITTPSSSYPAIKLTPDATSSFDFVADVSNEYKGNYPGCIAQRFKTKPGNSFTCSWTKTSPALSKFEYWSSDSPSVRTVTKSFKVQMGNSAGQIFYIVGYGSSGSSPAPEPTPTPTTTSLYVTSHASDTYTHTTPSGYSYPTPGSTVTIKAEPSYLDKDCGCKYQYFQRFGVEYSTNRSNWTTTFYTNSTISLTVKAGYYRVTAYYAVPC